MEAPFEWKKRQDLTLCLKCLASWLKQRYTMYPQGMSIDYKALCCNMVIDINRVT